MDKNNIAPHGTWKSPITAEMVAQHSVRIGSVVLDKNNIYWTETRPDDAGRNAIVRCDGQGNLEDLNSSPYNARTTVHEYGGGAFTVSDNIVYFSNYQDQRIYHQVFGQDPIAITPASNMRYADMVVDVDRKRLVCIREDHTGEGEAVNTIVGVDLAGGTTGTVLAAGNDFYASPRMSPANDRLAWITWNHPNMPWDGTELWVADVLSDGTLQKARLIAGGKDESIFQPAWSPYGVLYFVSDKSGWWNIYRHQNGTNECVCPREAEFGMPQWVFGMSTYAFLSETQIICAYNQIGVWHLAKLDLETGLLDKIKQPYDAVFGLWGNSRKVVFKGASPKEPRSLIQIDRLSLQYDAVRQTSDKLAEDDYLSQPEVIEFPTSEERTAFAYYYAPKNRDFEPPVGELPPLLVLSHGGPTDSASMALNSGIQFWTSRGFAVVDVNYGGSTGYGRAYRERLNGNWGIVDVDDCVNAATYLVERGLVDGARTAIRGGSAGGYTTFAALTFRDFFQAGASYYGVSDIEILAKETHKFESRYMDNLIGSYPEEIELLHERSPIYHIDKLSSPMILFQGLEDRVVLPNQSEMVVEALQKRGIPVAYLAFEGEQHGFRQAKNIVRARTAELFFYGKVFNFELADPVEPIEIANI
ncbi:MAG TPA: S9 family peptidase [candidate division Zixibacteria bacterium]|nr:S9 family peptidase [candidate division Zixibacteria bacterium]